MRERLIKAIRKYDHELCKVHAYDPEIVADFILSEFKPDWEGKASGVSIAKLELIDGSCNHEDIYDIQPIYEVEKKIRIWIEEL